jgi:hypothetical protein
MILLNLLSKVFSVGKGPRTPYNIDWKDLEDVKRYTEELAKSGRRMAVVRLLGAKGYRVYPLDTAEKMKSAEIIHRTE